MAKNNEEEFIKNNQNLVYYIIQHTGIKIPACFDYDDIFQVGCIGLLKAYRTFDKSKNNKFSSYAIPYISGTIKAYIRQHGTSIKISDRIYKNATKYYKYSGQKIIENNISPQELSKQIHISKKAAQSLINCFKLRIINLYKPVVTDKGKTLQIIDMLPIENDCSSLFCMEFIESNLNNAEKQVVLGLIQGKSQNEISKTIHICQSKVSNILADIRVKAKRYFYDMAI